MNEIEELFASLSPEDLAQLQATAAELFGGAGNAAASSAQEPPQAAAASPLPDAQLIAQISRVMQAMQKEDSRTRLIAALKPLLSAPRRKRADEAMRLLRLMELLPMLTEGKGGGLFG